MEKIPFTRINITENEEKEIIDCLRSGWITSGPRVAAFEKAFADYIGCGDAVAVSSGTAALHLALWMLELNDGDEIITPSLTWVSVPNLITILGARPVFCDVDPVTFNLDLEDVEKKITSKTKAIVPVHFAGRPFEIEALNKIAQVSKVTVIEDACHAIGSVYQNRKIGSHSELCAFSFHPNKNITTAEGGMLTGNNKEKLQMARLLRFHGVSRNTFKRTASGQLPYYESLFPGLKLNMTDLSASLGIHQLNKLDSFIDERIKISSAYRQRLAGLADRLYIPDECKDSGSIHAWHLFNICVEDKPGLREQIMKRLLEHEIQTGLHYLPVHLMSGMKKIGVSTSLPNTELIGRTIISLPLFPGMTDNQINRVVDVLYRELL